MSKHSENRRMKVLGIDLGKSSFQVHGVDGRGRKVVSRKLSRPKLKQYLVNLPACVVAMEAPVRGLTIGPGWCAPTGTRRN